jgi:hypothetical protein
VNLILKTQAPDFTVLSTAPTTVQTFGVALENSSDNVFETGIFRPFDPAVLFKLFKVWAYAVSDFLSPADSSDETSTNLIS